MPFRPSYERARAGVLLGLVEVLHELANRARASVAVIVPVVVSLEDRIARELELPEVGKAVVTDGVEVNLASTCDGIGGAHFLVFRTQDLSPVAVDERPVFVLLLVLVEQHAEPFTARLIWNAG
ncbi:MAG: hypothetical protein R3B70_35365 [Polyangiaceae bacterium]